jgi:hypothetical protein
VYQVVRLVQMEQDQRRYELAIHESGHALIAVLSGLQFSEVSIEPTATSDGGVIFGDVSARAAHRPFVDAAPSEGNPRSMLLTLAGGIVAECEVCGAVALDQLVLALPDMYQSFGLLVTVVPDGSARSAYVEALFSEVVEMIRAHRWALDVVTRQLLTNGRLSFAEVQAIVSRRSPDGNAAVN